MHLVWQPHAVSSLQALLASGSVVQLGVSEEFMGSLIQPHCSGGGAFGSASRVRPHMNPAT